MVGTLPTLSTASAAPSDSLSDCSAVLGDATSMTRSLVANSARSALFKLSHRRRPLVAVERNLTSDNIFILAICPSKLHVTRAHVGVNCHLLLAQQRSRSSA